MINFDSKMLRAATVMAAKDWSAPKVIQAARHMAHEGATADDIHRALWPDVTLSCVYSRLKRLNIRATIRYKAVRRGDITSLPPGQRDTDYRAYRPRAVSQ